MAKRNKTKIVDGYTTLRAAQRHVQQDHAPPRPASDAAPASTPPPKSSATIGRIGHTALPTKYEIVCYACDFEFKMTGKTGNTLCPRCKKKLDLGDHTVNEVFEGEIVTAGKVHLTAGAVLSGGRIVANDIRLEGTVKSGELKAHKTLELVAGASIPEKGVVARHLRIAAGMQMTFKKPVTFKDVEVAGELDADLTATGLVTIKPGGHLLGRLHTGHLAVEEGGGLSADVNVVPDEFTEKKPVKEQP